MINIILCDASANGIKLNEELLHRCKTINVVAVAHDSVGLLALLDKGTDADIIVIDIHLPFTNTLTLIRTIIKQYPHYKVLVHSVIDNYNILKLLIGMGVVGFLCKKEQFTILIEEAITNVHLEGHHYPSSIPKHFIESACKQKPSLPESGMYSITQQEEIVLKLLQTGKTAKEIAATLALSKRTIDVHCSNIYSKLSVTTRAGTIEIGSFKSNNVHQFA